MTEATGGVKPAPRLIEARSRAGIERKKPKTTVARAKMIRLEAGTPSRPRKETNTTADRGPALDEAMAHETL
jgi:hypothetical protein